MRPGRRGLERAGVIALTLFVAVAGFLWIEWWDYTVPSFGAARYQAVFLANGQTYFGRYLDRLGAYAKVEYVYYIQPAPATGDTDRPPDLRIVRRGAELHRPQTSMLIPKSAILFVEDLQPGSPFGQFMDRDRQR